MKIERGLSPSLVTLVNISPVAGVHHQHDQAAVIYGPTLSYIPQENKPHFFRVRVILIVL